MPPQVKKSGLAAKYGAKLDQAIKSHAADETNYGFIRLPGGINGGVAQLTECMFGIYKPGTPNAGEYYFRAAGVVIEPKMVTTPTGEMSVAGLLTSIMHPVCDTKNSKGEVTTQEQHIEDILNELRKLGADTAGATVSNLEDLAAACKQAMPYFRFSTTLSSGEGINPKTKKPYEPRVWENWNGTKGLENYSATEIAPGIGQDASPDIDPNMVDQGDLDALAKRADDPDNPDEVAQATLTTFAEQNGIADETMKACTSWSQVVQLIRGEELQPEPETNGFVVGNTYKYKAPAGPNKKPGKAIDVEMVLYDDKKGICNLKNLANQKLIYKGVKVAELESA